MTKCTTNKKKEKKKKKNDEQNSSLWLSLKFHFCHWNTIFKKISVILTINNYKANKGVSFSVSQEIKIPQNYEEESEMKAREL